MEIIIEKALDKFHDIMQNLDEYRARVREHVNKVVRERFTWERVGQLLRDVILRYLQ